MKVRIALGMALFMLVSLSVSASVLEDLAKTRDYESHRISSYDRAGGNGDGTQGNPVKVGETRTIAEISGPGEIAHIWFTLSPFDKDMLTNLILRMYWDGEKTPSVEAPIGAFFGLGHGKEATFDSLPFTVGNNRGLNCFFPMPFNKSARITLENQSGQQLGALYYYIDYKKFSAPRKDALQFHAQYRQAKPELSKDNYVALEAEGRGHYVGMFYYIRSNSGGWWGEGDDMIYIDGDKEPTLYGTGMEDYFCSAWGMKQGQNFLRAGAPLFEVYSVGLGNENTAYRWHLEDAVAFRESIRVTHEHGSNNDRNDDFFSVAFWYQAEPHAPFPALSPKFERLSFEDKKKALLETGKQDEYRALLSEFVDKAVDAESRSQALIDLAKSYSESGDKDSAVKVLRSCIGPMPVEGWTDRVQKLAQEMQLGGLSLPQSHVWLVNCGGGLVTLDTVAGSKCYRTDRATHNPYMYLKVRPGEVRDAEMDLVLEIECYGCPELEIEYNSATDNHQKVTVPAPQGAERWRTIRVELPKALLTGRHYCGTDIRMINPSGDICVRKITVKRK